MIWILLAIAIALSLFPLALEKRRRTVKQARRAEERRAKKDQNGRILEGGKSVKLSKGVTWYRMYGTATPNTMVLIHGLTTPSWVFSGLIDGLTRQGYQVLTYDLYGRGLSDRPGGAQDLAFFRGQLSELLDSLGLKGRVSLLGYSMGAMIASDFAATHPERVTRMIYLAPAGIRYTPGPLLGLAGRLPLLGNWLWSLLGARTLLTAAARDAKGPTVLTDLYARMQAEVGTRGYLRSVLSSHRNTLLTSMEDLQRKLGKTTIPALAIWGGQDPVIPQNAIGLLTQWNRNTHHHNVDAATHALPHSAPGEVMAAIREFLRDTA